MRALVLQAASHNPHETLALEEALLDTLPAGCALLYLYVHDNSVIVGRNQNAWAECRHELLLEEGGTLARRVSGGGAVYHDSQNLCFSFIVPKEAYDLRRQCGVIVEAVRSFGIEAGFSGRNDILANGRKFSGNAFCFRGRNAFHHGTILIDTDQERMQRYLAVSPDKIRAKGIESVRSRVVNLRELCSVLTARKMADSLISAFEQEYGSAQLLKLDAGTLERARQIATRNASWEWIFGKSPQFDIEASTRFGWGGVQILFSLRAGFVENALVFSDAMDEELISRLGPCLEGCAFRSEDLASAVRSLGDDGVRLHARMAGDIAHFLEERKY